VRQRTTVTISFCDLVGSTALLTQIGEAANDELRQDLFSVLRRPVEQLGGREVKTQGDGIMVAFQGRVTDAVACAIAWQQAIDALARRDPALRLALRVGLSTGVATSEEDDWFGTPVVEAARLCTAAGPSQILASEAVRLLVDDEAGISFVGVGALELKGFPEPRAAYEVPWLPSAHSSVVPKSPALDVTGSAPFAARIDERARLRNAIDASRAGTRRTVLVAGLAGMGKTRVVAEAVRDLGDTAVLACSWSEPGAYRAMSDALRWYVVAAPADALRRVLGADADVIAGLVPAVTVRLPDVGAGIEPTEVSAEHLIDAVVNTFARIATEIPLVLVFDDLQQASGPGLAVFLELATRPDLGRLTLVGAFRTDDDGAVLPALAVVLDKLETARDVERIDLVPLDAGAVATIAAGVDIDVEAVHAVTLGNPGQIVDAVRRLAVGDDPERALSVAFPFKGLVAFRAEDAALFFGRDDEIGTLLGRLARNRFAAVVGTSGSGKSSLVRAGLLPALSAGRLPGVWTSVALSPGDHPVAALDQALRGSAPRVVFVDQLEECVTQCTNPAERAEFLERLTALATRRDDETRVVVTARADLLGSIAVASLPFAALLESGSMFLGPMTDKQLLAVVEGPAAVAGLRLEPGLVDIVVNDVAGEPGALPLISHALLETWKRRKGAALTVANYREAGGARGAIARSADVVFGSLDARGQALARDLFLKLTELGDGVEDSRRRLGRAEVDAIGAPAEVASLLDQLAAARLITVHEGSIEVAHEALIRQWPRLREWLDESRDELRLEREVTRRAEEWDRLGRPDAELLRGGRLELALAAPVPGALEEQYLAAGSDRRDRDVRDGARRVRRLRSLLALAVALLLVAVAAGLVARGQSNRADARAADARAQTNLAGVLRLSAESITTSDGDLPVALPLAVEGLRRDNRYETRNALLSVLQREPALLGYLAAPAGGYNAGAIAPGGKVAALASATGIDLWNLAQRTRLGTLPVAGALDLAFASDSSVVVATPRRVEIWRTTGRAPERTIAVRPTSIALTSDHLVIGGPNGALVLASRSDGRIVARETQGTGAVLVVAAKNGTIVTAGAVPPTPGSSASTNVVVRDDTTLAPRRELATVGDPASDLAMSPSGRFVAIGSVGAGIPNFLAIDGSTPNFAGDVGSQGFQGPRESAHVAFVDDTTAISAGITGTTTTWRFNAPDGTRPAPHHNTQFGSVRHIMATPDGRSVWAIGAGAVGWSLAGVDSLGGAPSAPGLVATALSPNGRLLLVEVSSVLSSAPAPTPTDPSAPSVGTAISLTRSALVLDAHTLRPVGPSVPGNGLGFLADGAHVVVADGNGVPQIVDIATGRTRVLGVPPASSSPIVAADGRRVALASFDGSVSVLGAADGSKIADGLGRTDAGVPDVIAFGPRDAIAIEYSSRHEIVVIDARGTTPIAIGDAIGSAIAFSPDASVLAVGGADGTTRLYSLSTGKVDGSWLVGHTGGVSALEYSRNGELLASTSIDGTMRLFDVARRRPYGRPFPVSDQSTRFFDAAGTHVLDPTDGGIVEYPLDPAVWAARACDLAGANLSRTAWDLYLPGTPSRATCDRYPPP